jgi:hypothetical protein
MTGEDEHRGDGLATMSEAIGTERRTIDGLFVRYAEGGAERDWCGVGR